MPLSREADGHLSKPRKATGDGRKVIGRWMADFASKAEFKALPLFASVAGQQGLPKADGRWSVCRLAREMQRFVRPDIPEESCP